jgi:hypothetical protein
MSLAERLIALVLSTTFAREGDVWTVAFHQQSPKP